MLDHLGRTAAEKRMTLGFIGGSLRSAVGYAHFSAATLDSEWTLAAGCFSRDEATNAATGVAYGVEPQRVHADWRAMLEAERGRLDAMAVLTPTPDHAEMVVACLEAGFPVICEKALATTVDEAQRIAAALQRTRGYLAVTYNYSGYPMVREMAAMVASGGIGRVRHYQVEMPQEGFIRTDRAGNRPTPQAWRLQDGAVPTLYLDLAIHLHHLLSYVLRSQPSEVVVQQASHGWFPQVVDNTNALCRHDDGIEGHVWFSKSALGFRNGLRLRIYGTEGALEWLQSEPEVLHVARADGRREIVDRAGWTEVAQQSRYGRFKAGHPAGFVEAFANLYRDVADEVRALQQGRREASGEVFGVELALQGLAFLEAMQASAAARQWVRVAEQGGAP